MVRKDRCNFKGNPPLPQPAFCEVNAWCSMVPFWRQAEQDIREHRACPVHSPDQTVHTDEEKAIREVVDNVLWQMAADRKTTALKQLQGHMWRTAYMSGKIKGE